MIVLVDSRAGSGPSTRTVHRRRKGKLRAFKHTKKGLTDYAPLDSIGRLCHLDAGDVCISGNGPEGPVTVGVEVKSVRDLVSSIHTGRLQGTQIPAMIEEYGDGSWPPTKWLLYYGEHRVGPNGELQLRRKGRWHGYQIGKRDVPYGFLVASLLTYEAAGIHAARVADMREAAAWIGVLARWWQKEWQKHNGLRVFDNSHPIRGSRVVGLLPRLDPVTEFMAGLAKGLPGVGYERAVAAAEHFGCGDEMMRATAEEWAEVVGIGRVIGGSIRRAMEQRRAK